MKIYKSEIEAGLQEKIVANMKIAYASQLKTCIPDYVQYINETVKAAEKDADDLYYLQSILVTSNWNCNNDVFTPEEVWNARNTPVHKPTNLDHVDTAIVGHITSSWAIDEDEKIIAQDIKVDSLPDIFHIVTGSVIYRTFEDKDYKQRAEKLIAEIEEGTKYVSMECLFKGFDYAMSKENDYKIVARNEQTAFLTKYLTAYGGEGSYEDYKIGRVLKNVRFIAHGFVNRPANPNSIIFKKRDYFSFAKAQKSELFDEKGVLLNNDNSNVMENKMADETVNELKAELKDAKAKLDEMKGQVSKAGIEKLESDKKSLADQLDVANKDIKSKSDELNTNKAELDKAQKELASVKTELEKAKLAQTKANRVSTLVDGGIDKEVASQKVEKYLNLTDELFKDVADEIIAAKKANDAEEAAKKKFEEASKSGKDDKKDMKDDKKDKEKKDDKGKADESAEGKKDKPAKNKDDDGDDDESDAALDNVELEKEVDLNSDASKPNDELREAIASWAKANVLNK